MIQAIKRSLKWKLICIITAIIALIVTSIGLISYAETSRMIRANVERSSRQVLRQANLNLSRYYNEYAQEFLVMGSSSEFRSWLQYNKEDTFNLVMGYYRMRNNFMEPFVRQHPEIMSITLYSSKGTEYDFAATYHLDMKYKLTKEPWFSGIVDSNKNYIRVENSQHYLGVNDEPLSLPVMSIVKRYGNDGYLKMDISLAAAQSILDEIQIGDRQSGIISDDLGNILVHPDDWKNGTKLDADITAAIQLQDSGYMYREKTNEIVVYETIPLMGWKTLVIIPFHDVAGGLDHIQKVTLLIALLGLAVAVALVVGVTTSITKRLTKMRSIIKQTQLGKFDIRLAVSGTDEVADLGNVYNRMLSQLEGSIQQLTDSKLLQQRAILSALQSQINAHFLYNTLANIHSMADLAGHLEIENMAVALSRMLRYSSNYVNEIVPIADEIRYLQDYLQIITIRYASEVTYQIEIDPSCAECDCLKAILQPIVENSIKHGIEFTGEPIHLDIRVYEQPPGRVTITVTDTGTGFSEAQLFETQKKLSQSDKWNQYNELIQIGLLNVHYRLNMYYQDGKSGIRIANASDRGAIVTLSFPLTRNNRGE